jgi:hypothetical protein
MFTYTIIRNGKEEKKIAWGFITAIIAIITVAVITFVTLKAHAIKEMREDGTLLTITSFAKYEPHQEIIGMWDYANDTTGENYTNIEYIKYSGTYVVEVTTYDGTYIGEYEINPKYYGEDKVEVGTEIESYKLQELKRVIEKVAKEAPNKEALQSIKSVEKQEIEQNLVPIKNK